MWRCQQVMQVQQVSRDFPIRCRNVCSQQVSWSGVDCEEVILFCLRCSAGLRAGAVSLTRSNVGHLVVQCSAVRCKQPSKCVRALVKGVVSKCEAAAYLVSNL